MSLETSSPQPPAPEDEQAKAILLHILFDSGYLMLNRRAKDFKVEAMDDEAHRWKKQRLNEVFRDTMTELAYLHKDSVNRNSELLLLLRYFAIARKSELVNVGPLFLDWALDNEMKLLKLERQVEKLTEERKKSRAEVKAYRKRWEDCEERSDRRDTTERSTVE